MNRSDLSRAPAGFGTEPTEVARTPSTTYCVLNSADRFVNATPGQTNIVIAPYNNFRLQKPQALLDAFARRIQVSEIRFPWYIPNILAANREFVLILYTAPAPTLLKIRVDEGFYSPTALATAINDAMETAAIAAGLLATDAPSCGYINNRIIFAQQLIGSPRFGLAVASAPFQLGPPAAPITPYAYQTKPSLLKTIGVPVNSLTYTYDPLVGSAALGCNYSTFLYTDYIDIVSNKLNYYANIKDGASGLLTPPSLVCRIYAADECSLTGTQPVGTSPFVIHRQFKTPKSIEWDPTAFLDWVDISVFDQYGQLVPLPDGVDAYPDFQITLLGSES